MKKLFSMMAVMIIIIFSVSVCSAKDFINIYTGKVSQYYLDLDSIEVINNGNVVIVISGNIVCLSRNGYNESERSTVVYNINGRTCTINGIELDSYARPVIRVGTDFVGIGYGANGNTVKRAEVKTYEKPNLIDLKVANALYRAVSGRNFYEFDDIQSFDRYMANLKQREEQEKINKFNSLIAEGDRYYAAKDYENAKKAYQQARQLNGSKVDEYCNNLINNGDNLLNQKLYDSAKDYYKKAEIMGNQRANDKLSKLKYQKDTDNFNMFIIQGDKYYEVKDYENAKKAYQQARQINSSKVDEYCNNLINNGDNLANQKLYDSAIDYYKKAEIMGNQKANDKLSELVDTKTFQNLINEGDKLIKSKQYDQAIIKYQNAIKIKQDDSEVIFKLGSTYEEMKQYDKAIENYKKCIELAPNIEPGAADMIVDPKDENINTLIDGNGSTVKVNDKNMLTIYDDNKNYRGRLGRIYFKQKNYTEALKYFDEAITHYKSDYFGDLSDPNSQKGDNNIYWLRGQCNEQLQKYEAALKDYEEALKFEKENQNIIEAKQRVEKLLNKK